jgi:hypothetical protein
MPAINFWPRPPRSRATATGEKKSIKSKQIKKKQIKSNQINQIKNQIKSNQISDIRGEFRGAKIPKNICASNHTWPLKFPSIFFIIR